MISKHASDWLVILSIHTFSSFPRMSRMDVCVGGHHHRYPKPHAWPGMGSFRKIQELMRRAIVFFLLVVAGGPDRPFVQKLSVTEVRGRTQASRSAPGVPRAPVTPCTHTPIGSRRPRDRASFNLPIPYIPRPYLRHHTFDLRIHARLQPCRCLSRQLLPCLAVNRTRAHLCNLPPGPRRRHAPMRTGHAEPALGGLILTAGIGSWRQWSCSASLPVPVVGRPAACRPGALAIWVRRVAFFPPAICHAQGTCPAWDRTLQFTGVRAHVHEYGAPVARLDRNRVGFGVGTPVWGWYYRIPRFRSNYFPVARGLHGAGPQLTAPVVHRSMCALAPVAIWAHG